MNTIIKHKTLTAICLTFLLTFLILDANQVMADSTNEPLNDYPGRRVGGGSH